MDAPKKILILGGYGVFGGRLVELLSDIPELELVVCGRDLKKAQAYCTAYKGRATVRPLQLDRKEIAAALIAERPYIFVDASGPFQTYGLNCYSAIEASIAAGVHYLDFADAADFVFGMSKFDSDAKAAGVFVLSGVSSFPVLTAAVLREMSKTMDIVTVTGGIAPSPYAGIGLNVMRAVLGYAGYPVKLRRGGHTTTGIGLTESLRYTIAVPGKMPLKNIHFSLVDVPDLQVIPLEHKMMTDIWMGAGPVPEILHRTLNILAKLRVRFGLPSLVPLARLFYVILNLMKYGEHRGGMFISAQGVRGVSPVRQSWHLLAEGDDGPYIPSMAIEAIIRIGLSGNWPEHGARPGTNVLELAEYEKLFCNRTISTGFREEDFSLSLYQQLLGSAYDKLPAKVRMLHGSNNARQWRGRARVSRGKGLLARMICQVIGFPKSATDVPVSVSFTPESRGEVWQRNFDGKIFSSLQTRGTEKNEFLLVERFGWIDVALALVVDSERLFLVPRRWSCLGMPLPSWLLPRGKTFETEKNGAFCFEVEILAPVIGLIVAYSGELEAV